MIKHYFQKSVHIYVGAALGCVFFMGLLLPSPASAATYTWDDSSGDGLWSTCTNWSSDICPGSGDIAQFTSASTSNATIDSSFAGTVAGITIASGYTGTITQERNIVVNGTYSQADGTWIQHAYTIVGSDNSFSLSGGSFFAGAGTNQFERNMTVSGSGAITASSSRTFAFDGSGGTDDTTLSCSGELGVNIAFDKLSNSAETTIGSGCIASSTDTASFGPINVSGTLNLTGASLDMSDVDFTVNGSGTVTVPSGWTATLERDLTISGTMDLTAATSITFDGSGGTDDSTLSCSGELGVNVIFSKGNSSASVTVGSGCIATSTDTASFGPVVVSGTLNLTGASLDMSEDFTVNGSGTLTVPSGWSATFARNLTISGTADFSPATLITFDGSGTSDDSTLTCSGDLGVDIDVAKANSGAAFVLASGCEVTATTITSFGDVTINGTLDTQGNTLTGNSLALGTGATLKIAGDETLTVPTIGEDATVEYTGSGTYSDLNGITDFESIAFSGGGTYNITDAITVEDDFTSTNDSVFNQTAGTTTFDGAGQQTVVGTSTFNNLNKNVEATSTIFFGANQTQTLTGIVSLTGSTTGQLNLKSTATGTAYKLDFTGSETAEYLRVRDANNTAYLYVSCYPGCTDASNNTNFYFTSTPPPIYSGTIYEDQGVSAITTSKTIKIAIGTSTPSVHQVTSDSEGAWEFFLSDVSAVAPTTTFIFWVDNDSTTKAATTFKIASTTTSVNNVDLYQDHLIMRHGSGAPTTTFIWTGDFEFYDNDDDTDLLYIASSTASTTNTLVVKSDTTLYVWESTTFMPGGGLRINANGSSTSQIDGRLQLAHGASYIGGINDLEIGGSLILATSSTFFPHASGTYFMATTSGKMVGPLYGNDDEYGTHDIGHLTFSGVGGSWILGGATTSDITIATGTVYHAGSVTLTGDLSSTDDGYRNSGGTLVVGPGLAGSPIATSTIISSTTYDVLDGSFQAYEIKFKPDGTRMYIYDRFSNAVNMYTLSTPWEVSTASKSDDYDTSSLVTNETGLAFSPDGTRMYVHGGDPGDNQVYSFRLSTPWEVSSASVSQIPGSYSLAAQIEQPVGIFFKPDGTSMFGVDPSGNITEYILSTPWEVSSSSITVGSVNDVLDIGFETISEAVMSMDGTRMYLVSNTTADVYSVTFSTPWDMSTHTFEGSISSLPLTAPLSIAVKPDGTRFFVTDFNTNITQFEMTQPAQTVSGDFSADTALRDVEVVNASSTTFTGNASTSELTISASSTVDFQGNVSVQRDYTNNGTVEFNANTTTFGPGEGWVIAPTSTKLTDSGISTTTFYTGQGTFYQLFFKPDGTKYYIINNVDNAVTAFDLTVPWDVSTAQYNDESLDVGSETDAPRGLYINPSGQYVYVVLDNIYMYELDSPWDLSAGRFIHQFLPSPAGSFYGTDIFFRPDGLQFYTQDRNDDNVDVFNLSIPWIISTSTIRSSSTVISGHTGQSGGNKIFVSADGRTLYLGDFTNNELFAYVLSSPWDLSTASQVTDSSLPLATYHGGGADMGGFFVGDNGTKLFISGSSSVYQIDIKTQSQTATGSMTGESAFYDLTISNVGANGTTSQSVVFGSQASTTGTFTMLASTSASFLANATNTFQNIDLRGTADSPVWIRSSSPDTQTAWDVPGTQVSVSSVNVRDNYAVNTITTTDGIDSGNNTNWLFVSANGSSTISDHDLTQINNAFDFQNKTNEPLFAFKIIPQSGNATITDMIIEISGVIDIDTDDFSNIRLFRDLDNDADYDATEPQVGGAGAMSVNGQLGSITFSDDFLSTTSQNYLVVADWNAPNKGSALVLDLWPDDIVAIDANGTHDMYGEVDMIQHERFEGKKESGSNVGIAIVGRATTTGGGEEGGEEIEEGGEEGENIVFNPNFFAPTGEGSPQDEWTGGANGIGSDGVYATAASAGLRQSYSGFGLSIPAGNTIEGIEVKIDASGSTAAGTIDVALSWNSGASVTTVQATPVLSGSDLVYTIGGNSDTWGRAWSPDEFNDTNFRLRIIGQPDSNTVRVDALEVRVYHQAGGGGAGGGGSI